MNWVKCLTDSKAKPSDDCVCLIFGCCCDINKKWKYVNFPCVSLADFFSTTLCNDLGKVSITAKLKHRIKICNDIMTTQHFN